MNRCFAVKITVLVYNSLVTKMMQILPIARFILELHHRAIQGTRSYDLQNNFIHILNKNL